MATIPDQEFFAGVKDPIYNVTQKPVSIDQDTIRKSTRIIPATSNGSGTLADPLNGPQPKRTTFNFSNGNTQRMRWDTTCLEVDLALTDHAGTGACPANNAPDWNLFGRLIDQITLRFNGSGTEIYNKAGGYYLADFTARMLRYYTLEQLNKKDDCIFTPIDDYEYIWERPADVQYESVGAPTIARLVNVAGADVAALIASINANIVTALNASAKLIQPQAPSVATFPNVSATAGTALNSARLRYIKYCSVDATGSTSNQRRITLRVPFLDLFPRFQGVLKNLRSVQIDIQWANSLNLLSRISVAPVATADGQVRVTATRIITDDYVMSHGQTMENLSEKMAGEVDNIAFLEPVVHSRTVSGNDIIITAQRNVDSVMLFQMGHQVAVSTINPITYTDAAPPQAPADAAAGLANERLHMGASSGQFFLLNSEATLVANHRKSSWGVPNNAVGQVLPPTTVQLIYGDLTYPQAPIEMQKEGAFNPAGLYNEYLKAIGKVGDRLNGSPITLDLFGSTMPFIFLKPFANDAIKLSDSKDIILRFSNVGNLRHDQSKRVWVVLFELASFRIATDGSVSTMGYK